MSQVHPHHDSPGQQVHDLGRLGISSARVNDAHTVTLTGELDMQGAPRLEEELMHVESTHPSKLIIDLADLEFIDSSGLRVLVSAHKRCLASDSWTLLIIPPIGPAIRTFEICGLMDALPMAGKRAA